MKNIKVTIKEPFSNNKIKTIKAKTIEEFFDRAVEYYKTLGYTDIDGRTFTSFTAKNPNDGIGIGIDVQSFEMKSVDDIFKPIPVWGNRNLKVIGT